MLMLQKSTAIQWTTPELEKMAELKRNENEFGFPSISLLSNDSKPKN